MTTSRRSFIKTSGLAAVAAALPFSENTGFLKPKNRLPRWKGFNLLDFFNAEPPRKPSSNTTTSEDLKWMADWGFNFIRIPMAYPRYVSFDRTRSITQDEIYNFDRAALEEVDKLVNMAIDNGMHVSLNLHRAPGYCINAGFREPFNIWKDEDAQKAFYAHWKMWAERYKHIPRQKLSFDLLNEPSFIEDMNDQYTSKKPVPGETYKMVALNAAKAIWEANPDRLVIADGNNIGNDVTQELKGTEIAQSCRGYWPGVVSHFQASWVWKDPSEAPVPVWPGIIDGKRYGREQLEDYYKPWIEAVSQGVGVHCGECGCYNRTPHQVFLAWFGDVVDILSSAGIGYALWNFRGDFGILDSRRTDVDYKDWYGHKLDSKLLGLLKKY